MKPLRRDSLDLPSALFPCVSNLLGIHFGASLCRSSDSAPLEVRRYARLLSCHSDVLGRLAEAEDAGASELFIDADEMLEIHRALAWWGKDGPNHGEDWMTITIGASAVEQILDLADETPTLPDALDRLGPLCLGFHLGISMLRAVESSLFKIAACAKAAGTVLPLIQSMVNGVDRGRAVPLTPDGIRLMKLAADSMLQYASKRRLVEVPKVLVPEELTRLRKHTDGC